jgi:hypothetical protein
MSFLDRIPGLRRLSQSTPTDHVMSTVGLVKGLVRTGKWVFYFPTKEVGILADIRNFPEVVVMLTKPDGTAYKIWLIWDDGSSTSNSGSPFGSAEFKTPYLLSAESGTFTLTGNEAVLSRVSLLSAEPGAFTFTGNAANLLASRTITAESGNYTLTGGEANLSRQLVLSAETGNYTYTGNDAALYKVYLLSAATGEFQLTGNNIELLLSRRLLADAGTFTLTGNNAALTKTGGGGSSAADI